MINRISNYNICLLSALFLMLIMTSCSNEENLKGNRPEGSEIVEGITVAIASRAGEQDSEATDKEPTESELETGITARDYIPFVHEWDTHSVIFVSQQTEKTPPFQKTEDIYAYKYIEDSEADWEDGYNFTPLSDTDPLEWFKIGNGGSYRGGFALYALYFPLKDEIEQREESGKIIYSVESDQSTLENLQKSDILGAYHSTPSLFTRLNFRLFHLMTYLRIRLYVPVYDPVSRTGYYDDALVSANLNYVTPEFAVEWSTLRSSDTEGPAISALNGSGSIQMYQHPLPEGQTQRELKEIKYNDFLPSNFFDQPLDSEYDNVRVYDFSVIIPVQKGPLDENGKETNFAETDFLNFILQSNSGALNKYYFNQSMKFESIGSNLQLNQGVFQFMELYVPRVGNKIICMSATLNPWQHRATSFPLASDEDK